MSRIDEVKKILNILRVGMTDYLFWVGTLFVFVLLLTIMLIIRKISTKTKEIKDL